MKKGGAPGNTQAFTDTPIYARNSGYLQRWYVDIGARVKAGQLLASYRDSGSRSAVAAGAALISKPLRPTWRWRSQQPSAGSLLSKTDSVYQTGNG